VTRPLIPFALAVALLAGTAPATAKSLAGDGMWWQALTDHEQTIALIGLIDGFAEGYDIGSFGSSVVRVTDHPRFSKSYGEYQAAVSAFYADYRDGLDLHVSEVLNCLQDKTTDRTGCYEVTIKLVQESTA
jgi:hypothetical protein